jgi:hypothetical protein
MESGEVNEAPNRTKRDLPANSTMARRFLKTLSSATLGFSSAGYHEPNQSFSTRVHTKPPILRARGSGHDMWLTRFFTRLVT